MNSSMMLQPLLISSLISHACRHHADTPVISKNTDGSIVQTNWQEVAENSGRFAQVLDHLGLARHDRIATIAWNNHRHLESWYGISGSERICHTINPRLFPEQLIFIINDANDRVLLFDKTFLPLIIAIKAHIPRVEHFILLDAVDVDAQEKFPQLKFYDELIARHDSNYEWPQFDETTPSSLCYTSGTTGNPKGALYSHRSTLLHSFAIALPDSLNLSASDVMLPVVPMFHVNAWGTPYAAAMVGSSLILPGPGLDGASLVKLIDDFKVTVALGVPTIWQGLISAAKQLNSKLSSLKRNIVGGAACPASMLNTFQHDFECETIHAWGMTEISPLGTANQLKAKHQNCSDAEKSQIRLSQGRPPFGVDIRICDQENSTKQLVHDGQSSGNVQVKGHWVIESYYAKSESALTTDGWFDTGDIATLDHDSYLRIQDRAKDLIKSGGEWISSVELENIAMDYGQEICMAAVIAASHPKWDERPVLIAVKTPDSNITDKDLLQHYENKVAKWQIPDKVIFVDSIPLNGTGKMLKKDLRDLYGNVLISEQK